MLTPIILFLVIVIFLLIFRNCQMDCRWLEICHCLLLSSYSSKEEVLEEIKELKESRQDTIIFLEDKKENNAS